ncbi:NUDIX hydrolase [Microlunatus sp. GCM10028923]|uniref:NUDIX hydrolase n=1 Tax=Microlunatus sp. GCM10028923 TaxID=3273400 RepID=UPI003618A519
MWDWETSVVLVRDPSGRVLLVRQNYGQRFFGLPGGKIEDGESPGEAAMRELFEETGLRTESVTPHSVHELTYPVTGGRYRAHVFTAESLSGTPGVQQPSEISSVAWYDPAALPDPLTPSARAVLTVP